MNNNHIYWESSWNEMSKEQLIRRGSCCALGCKNCPYTKPRIKGNKKLENDKQRNN